MYCMVRRDQQVNIRLTEERKQRWKEAAEERERPLTELIRWSVQQAIRDNASTARGASRDEGKLDTILEQLQSLDASISDGPGSISHQLTAIEGQLADDPQERELASKVYGLLPSEGQVSSIPDLDNPSARVGENGRVVTGVPKHIAEYIRSSPDFNTDVREDQVRHALTNLQSELHNVHSLGDGRYYRS